MAAPATSRGSDATASAPSYLSSLPMNPRNGGNPAMENAAAAAAAVVIGMARARPPRRSTSRVPVSWSIIPMTRNSADLYRQWTIRKVIAAVMAIWASEPRNMVSVPRAMTVV